MKIFLYCKLFWNLPYHDEVTDTPPYKKRCFFMFVYKNLNFDRIFLKLISSKLVGVLKMSMFAYTGSLWWKCNEGSWSLSYLLKLHLNTSCLLKYFLLNHYISAPHFISNMFSRLAGLPFIRLLYLIFFLVNTMLNDK